MTPNAGQGGNAAIESAAAPANQIYLLLEETKGAGPTYDRIKRSLSGFQARLDQRISAILKTSNDLTRAHALKSVAERIMVQYFVSQMGDYLVDLLSDMYIGAELLEFLPPPHRSLLATMPFNLTQGLGKHESRLRRALWALPLLVMSALTVRTMAMAGLMYPVFHGIFETSRFEWKGVSVPIIKQSYQVPFIDKTVAPITITFA